MKTSTTKSRPSRQSRRLPVSISGVTGAAIFAMIEKPLSPTAQVVMSAIGRGYTRCGVIALKARLSKSHAAIVLSRLYAAGRITRKQRDGNHGRYPAYDYALAKLQPKGAV